MGSIQPADFQRAAVAPVAPKRIVVCCDGTWQSSVTGLKNIPSNITRLARSISRSGKDATGQVWQQIVHYDAGIGTGELTKEEKDRQGGFGIGFIQNVIEAYNFIVLNYAPGDQIFCFGFSRGAYTARAVAGLVNDIGVISPRDMQDFPDLYALYQKNEDSHGFRKSTVYREWVNGVLAQDQPTNPKESPRYLKPPHKSAPESSRVVQVVGVFDTVGSLGIPDLSWTQYHLKFLEKWLDIPNVGFHNVALSPYVRHAFHALALDEHRGPFSPTLWHVPELASPNHKKTHDEIEAEWDQVHADKNATATELSTAWSALIDCEMYDELKGTDSELLQVWFPGVHINVGGGSDDILTEMKGDFEQLALITFAWMCEQVAPYLQLDTDLDTLARGAVEDRYSLMRPALDAMAKADKDALGSPLSSKGLGLLEKAGLKKAQVKGISKEVINGWATGPIVDSYAGLMAFAGSVPRTPGRYAEDKSGKVKLGQTNEYIHPSVEYRKRSRTDYRPKPLEGFTRSARQSGSKGYDWTSSTVTIPEYVIKPEHRFTRYIVAQDTSRTEGTAHDFIAEIDKIIG
ncbi:hypothetical protein JX265_008795 [Neoarthrinium moseri]|uniref:T6SS Phospholipase effector Tle1-like catalytic domain-containing protein n=1 Tax=Neoarthrinium moseri TaxID=1658444 RepID=A0A9P9WHI0_9PEZI|nr:uncharacterized protein JN550_009513 [Neoarthrinium moseri]KAI1848423.1 hypothetical protein JX266_005729 [Neoarthrinium moseri]KAI1863402.1 hypothetical protein JN550_009513 [Neoarthrinium moseri]KAI1863578.1 hypothetical protein JX265_008795 [Neoarthrinium moseri]